MKFTFIVYKNGKPIQKCSTHKLRRFIHRMKLINWQNTNLKIYLKISYGEFKNNTNKLQTFYNDGFYTNKQDYDLAFRAFLEK